MAEHTPGPWHFDAVAPVIVGPDGQVVARVWAIREPVETNGRLMAAAPELLDGLRVALALARDAIPYVSEHLQRKWGYAEELARLDAVVAKAEGRA